MLYPTYHRVYNSRTSGNAGIHRVNTTANDAIIDEN